MKYIVTESQLKNLRVRRNIIDELPKFITSTFEWLNPKAFNNFDEFLERVIFSATRDYVGNFIESPEEFDNLKNLIEPTVREIVMGRYYDEIFKYFYNQS
jgi:hypothetical protein